MVVLPWAWLSLRLVFGVAFAGLFMVIESWLNDQTTSSSRGRVFATYMIATWLGVVAGKMVFPLASPDAYQLFSFAAIAIGLSIVPVTLTTGAVPSIPHPARLRLTELYRLAPVGVIGCLCVGVANGAFWSFSPLFAQDQGATALDVSLFLSACVLGGLLSQWPLGWYSDRVDRRRVILGASLIATIAGFALVLQAPWQSTRAVLLLLAAIWGASALSVYSLCVAHANDRADPGTYVAISSHLLLTFGFGAMVGPLAAGLVIDSSGISSLFLFTAFIHAALTLFVAYRIRVTRPVAGAERVVFSPQVPAGHGTQVMLDLAPAGEQVKVDENAVTRPGEGTEGAEVATGSTDPRAGAGTDTDQ
jgi:MFS family permease